jgi:trehalose 6-phosphate phosphatase
VSDIAPAPDESFVDGELRGTLDDIAHRYRLWFLTGRDADLAREIAGVPEAGYIGAHGLEALDGDELRRLAEIDDVAGPLDTLATAVARALPGAADGIERKHWSVAFHYRAFPELAERLKDEVASRLVPSLALREGKMVFEVGPAVEHDKGTALAWLIETHAPRRVLAAGDDLTDVAMFRALAERRARGEIDGVAVAVLQPGETPAEVLDAADTAVDGVAGLHRLLLELLAP